jgi:hypothetical protein
MAVHFIVRINGAEVGGVKIQRVEPLDFNDPAVADAVCTYDVRHDGRDVGQVRHRYGDDAYRLVSLATALIAEENA